MNRGARILLAAGLLALACMAAWLVVPADLQGEEGASEQAASTPGSSSSRQHVQGRARDPVRTERYRAPEVPMPRRVLVVDLAGGPVEGARVIICRLAPEPSGGPPRAGVLLRNDGVTSRSGHAPIPDDLELPLHIRVMRGIDVGSVGLASLADPSIEQAEGRSTVRVVLTPGGYAMALLRGRLLDGHGHPLRRSSLLMDSRNADGSWPGIPGRQRIVISDPDGRFEYPVGAGVAGRLLVMPGTARLPGLPTPEPLATATYPSLAFRATLDLGDVRLKGAVLLATGVALDGSGAGAPDLTVQAHGAEIQAPRFAGNGPIGHLLALARTAGDGSFTLVGAPRSGRLILTLGGRGGRGAPLEVRVGAREVILRFERNGGLRGRVLRADPGLRVPFTLSLSPREAPRRVVSVRPREQGRFEVLDLEPGLWVVKLRVADSVSQVGEVLVESGRVSAPQLLNDLVVGAHMMRAHVLVSIAGKGAARRALVQLTRHGRRDEVLDELFTNRDHVEFIIPRAERFSILVSAPGCCSQFIRDPAFPLRVELQRGHTARVELSDPLPAVSGIGRLHLVLRAAARGWRSEIADLDRRRLSPTFEGVPAGMHSVHLQFRVYQGQGRWSASVEFTLGRAEVLAGASAGRRQRALVDVDPEDIRARLAALAR